MEILYILLVLLAVTRIFGEIAERLGQPALVGELLAGIMLGILVGLYHDLFPAFARPHNEAFTALTDLGMFFLMLLAGIEMQPRDLVETSRRAFFVALGGLLVPLASGFALGWAVIPASPYRFAQCLFLGTALAITAVPVSVRILMDLGLLESVAGRTIVSAALFDDVLSLVILAVLMALIQNGELPSLAMLSILIGKVTLFFLITLPVGWYVFPWFGRRFRFFRIAEVDLSMLIIAALGYAVLAEALDLHFIVGAFLAGVFFERSVVDLEIYERVEKQVSGLTTGFLAPIFFASIGLNLDLHALWSIPGFLAVLILVAFIGKIVGAGLPARWAGLSRQDAQLVGIGMSGRGAVELIIAGVALREGLFLVPDPPPPIVSSLFSAVVIMAVVTTVLTPILLRLTLARNGAPPS